MLLPAAVAREKAPPRRTAPGLYRSTWHRGHKPSDLRHTFAVLSLQNGDDVKTVQMNLGHASAAFTLDVYGHVSDRMQRESAARMEQYIASVSRMEPST